MPSCHITHSSMNTRQELLSSWPTCHNVTGASQSATHHLGGVDSPTYKYHLRNDKKVLSWLVLLSPPLWCWYVAPPQSPAEPRQTCRAPVTGAELFIIELRNCRSGLNLWIPGGDWLVINIIGGNYVSYSDTGGISSNLRNIAGIDHLHKSSLLWGHKVCWRFSRNLAGEMARIICDSS